ncbi:uroporphyrinogen decarboxylase family protein [Bacteroidota bacterium]
MAKSFNFNLPDSQATEIKPLRIENFNIEEYIEYEKSLLDNCKNFWNNKNEGVLVYRRMRVADVFAYDCKDKEKSLEWQLGALKESVKYKADIPNFLEPWYGIGTIASSFGFDYKWEAGLAPTLNGKFKTAGEALDYDAVPVSKTSIGKHTIEMIEYFLDKTKGKLPISYCDVQSPLNIAGNMIDINNYFIDFYMNPDIIKQLHDKIADLMIEFTKEQNKLLGNTLVYPGHGFASCRSFDGFGMSDDNLVMISEDLYTDLALPSFIKIGDTFNGSALHSCGNWSDKVNMVRNISNLKMIDAAFSIETDPDPNNPEAFANTFKNTGIIVNARIVGDLQTISEKIKKIWKPGMKLIVVTYCKTNEEQNNAYKIIHDLQK